MLLFFPLFSTILYDRYVPIQTLMITLLRERNTEKLKLARTDHSETPANAI